MTSASAVLVVSLAAALLPFAAGHGGMRIVLVLL